MEPTSGDRAEPDPDEAIARELDRQVRRLDRLRQEGAALGQRLAADPAEPAALAAFRRWQAACSETVGELAGGRKDHWLARAYGDAFLVPASGPTPTVDSSQAEIAGRIVRVLGRARRALLEPGARVWARPGEREPGSAASEVPARDFEFVKDADLRARFTAAYREARAAEARANPALAFVIWCSLLEAVITDALEAALGASNRFGAPDRPVTDWSFATRIEVAERARLISRGCARLPALAREYHRLLEADGELRPNAAVSERDARTARQVLHVVLRDLAQGR